MVRIQSPPAASRTQASSQVAAWVKQASQLPGEQMRAGQCGVRSAWGRFGTCLVQRLSRAFRLERFRDALVRESHTIKRALTDPRLFSGIGNAYSDEILHAARLSPVKLTRSLTEDEVQRLFEATQRTLLEWAERLRREAGERFPEKVTAFHVGMAVHGRYGKPCPACGAPIARIAYADNETNYCARCQTGGRLLADRALSRLLRGDWPRSLEEMEGLRRR